MRRDLSVGSKTLPRSTSPRLRGVAGAAAGGGTEAEALRALVALTAACGLGFRAASGGSSNQNRTARTTPMCQN